MTQFTFLRLRHPLLPASLDCCNGSNWVIIMKSSESLKARSVRHSYNLVPPWGHLSGRTVFCFLVSLQRKFSPKETNSSLLPTNNDRDRTNPPPPRHPIFTKTGCLGGRGTEWQCDQHVLPGNASAHCSRPENSWCSGAGLGRQE